MKRSPPDLVLFRAFGRHMAVSTAEQSTLKTRSGSYDFNRDAHIPAGKLGPGHATTSPPPPPKKPKRPIVEPALSFRIQKRRPVACYVMIGEHPCSRVI